jgi:hypothetical protein
MAKATSLPYKKAISLPDKSYSGNPGFRHASAGGIQGKFQQKRADRYLSVANLPQRNIAGGVAGHLAPLFACQSSHFQVL